jgi:2'-5' RNA ligase
VSLVLDDAIPALQPVRAEFDPAGTAALVPLHVTLLFPFVPRAALDQAVLHRLTVFCAARPPFAFALARVAEFPGVLYAAPEPAEPIRACMRELWAEFPDYPPYGGEFTEPVPHATLGRIPEGVDQQVVRRRLEDRVRGLLPIPVAVPAASLLEEVEPDRWREARRFAFATGSGGLATAARSS